MDDDDVSRRYLYKGKYLAFYVMQNKQYADNTNNRNGDNPLPGCLLKLSAFHRVVYEYFIGIRE